MGTHSQVCSGRRVRPACSVYPPLISALERPDTNCIGRLWVIFQDALYKLLDAALLLCDPSEAIAKMASLRSASIFALPLALALVHAFQFDPIKVEYSHQEYSLFNVTEISAKTRLCPMAKKAIESNKDTYITADLRLGLCRASYESVGKLYRDQFAFKVSRLFFSWTPCL